MPSRKVDEFGETIFHWACETGKSEIVKKILESKNWNLREKMELLTMKSSKYDLCPLEIARKREEVSTAKVCFSSFFRSILFLGDADLFFEYSCTGH